MKKVALTLFILLIASALITSCGDWSNFIPKSTFDAPFPKANKNLTEILGKRLYIKRGKDTTKLNVSATDKLNLITDKNGDTIFCGTVSKFRGMYYFSQQLNDTAYLIYAVRIKGDLLYGLNAPWYEGILIDHRILKGEFKDMVKHISADGKIIRLHPVKHEMKKLFAEIMDSIPPDTLIPVPQNINTPAKIDTSAITQQIDTDEFDMLSKVYPNPAVNEVNIVLQQKEDVKYSIADMTGKTLAEGELHDVNNPIDISKLHGGIYVITLVNADGKQQESVRIIKQD